MASTSVPALGPVSAPASVQAPGPAPVPAQGPAPAFRVIIPARFGATRLPGKPLLTIDGKPLIQMVFEQANRTSAMEILVATDDERIAAACRAFGAPVVMTRADHPSGSDRLAEVIRRLGWPGETLVVNLQGDEPCMPPALVDQVAASLAAHSGVGMATLAYPISDAETLFDPQVVKVVTDARGRALYFSRAPIPWHRQAFAAGQPCLPPGMTYLRHIGLYAYRAEFLQRYVAWPPAPPERAESLEQLRVLWQGEAIQVDIAAQLPGPGVDTAADLQRVRAFLGLA